MAKPGLAAVAGILLITLYSKGDAGHTFVYNCSNYTVHKPPIRRIPSWWESHDLCKQTGSVLVSIETHEELNFLKEKLSMNSLKYEYFIGLRKLGRKWRWISNNSTVDAPHKYPWFPSEPSGNGKCVKMFFRRTGELRYDDLPCGIRYHTNMAIICERPVDCRVKTATRKRTTTQTMPVTSASQLTKSTQQESTGGQTSVYNCSNYTVNKPPIRSIPNWWESLNLCKQNGTALVSIEDQEELNFLKEKLSTSNHRMDYFIGLRKLGGKWRWISNNSTVVAHHKPPWDSAQPSGNGNCAKMYFSYSYDELRYDDIPCGSKHGNIGIICERPVNCRVETDINGCANNPCQNGATCSNTFGAYYCTCEQGFEGRHCDRDVDECVIDKAECTHKCVNTVGGYTCECPDPELSLSLDNKTCHGKY